MELLEEYAAPALLLVYLVAQHPHLRLPPVVLVRPLGAPLSYSTQLFRILSCLPTTCRFSVVLDLHSSVAVCEE